MPPLIEPLHRGLVDKPDPATLQEGELTLAEDCYYPPDERTLRLYPGRTLEANLASVAEPDDPVTPSNTGVDHITFDDDPRAVFIVRTGRNIFAYLRGDLSSLQSTTPSGFTGQAETTISQHYANAHYLFDGVNPGQVVRQDIIKSLEAGEAITLDRIGMDDTTAAPGLVKRSDAGDGNWGEGVGTFWYLVTEYDIDYDIESGTTADPSSIGFETGDPTTGVSVIVTRPAILNARATHWVVYRAQSDLSPGLNQFVRVGIVDVSVETFADDDGLGGATDSATASIDVTNLSGTEWSDLGAAIDGDDDTYAHTSTPGTSAALRIRNVWSSGEQATLDAGIPVAGLKLVMTLSGDDDNYPGNSLAAIVQVSPDGGATWLNHTSSAGGHLTLLTFAEQAYTFGGESNPWYYSVDDGGGRYTWQAGDFANGQFAVRVFMGRIGGAPTLNMRVHEINEITFYINGQIVDAAPIGEFFPTLPIAVPGSVTAVSPANGPPSIASTATVYEASLVTNDVSDPSRIVWSFADEPEQFPPAYFLNIETPDRDRVTCLRATQDWLFVGMERSVYRVNYLPTESDIVFDRGRAFSLVDTQHGCVGPRAATTFNLDNQPTMVAFIDRYHGPVACDAHRIYHLVEGLDWASKVDASQLHRCVLVNYAPWQALLLYYVPRGGKFLSRVMVFSYEAMHRRGPVTLSVTGPCRVPEGAGIAPAREGSSVDVYLLDPTLSLWREFQGADEAEVGRAFNVRSRVFYPLGLGQEARSERMYVRYRDMARCKIRATNHYEVVGGKVRAPQTKTYERDVEVDDIGHLRLELDATAESFQAQFEAVPDSGSEHTYSLGVDHFALWVTPYGRQD